MDGATTKDLLEGLEDYVLDLNTHLVIILAGKNDMHRKISVKSHLKNINKIIKKLKKQKIDIVFISSTPSLYQKYNENFRKYVTKYDKFFSKNRVTYFNLFNEFQNYDLERFFTFKSPYGIEELGIKSGQKDPFHPNQLGNAYIAQTILEKVFAISFDPEKYIEDTNNNKMYPSY